MIQYIGYTASVLILISLMMRSLVKLRYINLAGCIFFIIYGLALKAYPVAFLNLATALVNIYYLFIKKPKEHINIDLIKILTKDLSTMQMYKDNKQEIIKYFGTVDIDMCNTIYLLIKNNQIAGLLAGNIERFIFEIKIDYVFPEYRDYKIGQTIYQDHKELLKSRNIDKLKIQSENNLHIPYLLKMGFTKHKDNWYELDL